MFSPIGFFACFAHACVCCCDCCPGRESAMSGFVVWARVRRRRRIERGCVSRRKYGTMLEKRKLLEGNRRNDPRKGLGESEPNETKCVGGQSRSKFGSRFLLLFSFFFRIEAANLRTTLSLRKKLSRKGTYDSLEIVYILHAWQPRFSSTLLVRPTIDTPEDTRLMLSESEEIWKRASGGFQWVPR